MEQHIIGMTARRLAGVCGVLALLATTGGAVAQTAAASHPVQSVPPITAGGGFYQDLGGREGVAAIVAEFVRILLADQRLAATFEGVDMDRLHEKLAEQFCQASGGACAYTGKSMAEVHEDLKINNAQFNASVEDLQLAMARCGIPSRMQNRLLGKLASTQHAIVTK